MFPQAASPPVNWPITRWFWSKRGDPDEPPSVVPLSQSATRICVPVPGTVGVMVEADASRVFLDGETSSVWHPAFGAGVFFEMVRGLDVFSVNVWRGDEETLFSFKSGFDF